MPNSLLEHVNITVSDPKKTAAMLSQIFGWHVRWEGPAMGGGHSVHVGTDTAYVALWGPHELPRRNSESGARGGLNHVGVVVDDLDATEARIKILDLATFSHGSYAPGRRFYFNDHDGIEWEVVSYT